jgi:hypothetical protein
MDLTEAAALRILRGQRIKLDLQVIVLTGPGPGIKTWGVIDYLCRKHGYAWSRN